jgi:hypothetical protein
MSLEDLGNIGEFVAAVAVVISLVYLAVQIRQNTRSVRSATYQGLFDHIADFQNLFLANEKLGAVWSVGSSKPDSLSRGDRERFDLLVLRFFRQLETLHYQWREGLLNETLFRGWIHDSVRRAEQPGVQLWWDANRSIFGSEFQAWWDSTISEK